MIKYYFSVFLLVHILSDFYMQTESAAVKKKDFLRWTLYHCGIYAAVSLILLFVFMPGMGWQYALIFILSHCIIDIVKYYVNKLFYQRKIRFAASEFKIFLCDQGLHICVIVLIAYMLRDADILALCNAEIAEFFSAFGFAETTALAWGLKILLLHKPANIFISKALESYRPQSKEESQGDDKKAGRFIGTLERLIIMIFISIDQYAAVGLVLTAKSIARYDKISKDKEFSEYYLLGTLLSTITAICVSILL